MRVRHGYLDGCDGRGRRVGHDQRFDDGVGDVGDVVAELEGRHGGEHAPLVVLARQAAQELRFHAFDVRDVRGGCANARAQHQGTLKHNTRTLLKQHANWFHRFHDDGSRTYERASMSR